MARELGKELAGEAMRGSFGKDGFWYWLSSNALAQGSASSRMLLYSIEAKKRQAEMQEDKEKGRSSGWEEAEAVVCPASWWLGGAGAGALLYRLSIGFGGGCKPGQKRKKNKWMPSLV